MFYSKMKKVILINFFTIVIFIVFFEFVLRFFFSFTPQGMDKGLILEDNDISEHSPNYSGGLVFGKKVYTDENGFRVPYENFSEKKFKKKIIFLGGSVTFGTGVNEEDSFVGILRKNVKAQVINAAVIGSDLRNNSLLLKKINLSKDVINIFINFGLDDIPNFDNKEPNRRGERLEGLRKIPFVSSINDFIKSKSVIFVWLKGVIFDPSKNYYLYDVGLYKNLEKVSRIDKYLESMREINLKNNSKIVFLIIPMEYQTRGGNCKKRDIAQNIIKEKLNKYNFKYIDLIEDFCKNKKTEKLFLYKDPAHLSKKGHEVVYKKIINYLRN